MRHLDFRFVAFVVLVGCSPSLSQPAAAPKSGRPKTRQELATAVVSAIRTKDVDALARLYLTESDLEVCSASAPKEYAGYAKVIAKEVRGALQQALERCAELVPDWDKAVHTETLGGELDTPIVGCEAIKRVHDIDITYDVAGRSVHIELVIPLLRDGYGYILTDRLTCKADAL